MEEGRIIIEKIRSYINEQKIPPRVKKLIEDIYRDYEDAYISYLSNMQRIIYNNDKLSVELNNIESYAKNDYENDIVSTNELVDMIFQSKINEIREEISNIVNEIQMKKDNSKTDLEEEREEERNYIKKYTSFSSRNKDYAMEFKESVVAEIESSRKLLITKIQNNIPKSNENATYIEHARTVFENEVNLILSKAKLQLPTEIKNELDILDDRIINDTIRIYDNEHKVLKEQQKSYSTKQREDFAAGLKRNINEEEALRKVLEEQQRQTSLEINGQKLNLDEGLPGNVIE